LYDCYPDKVCTVRFTSMIDELPESMKGMMFQRQQHTRNEAAIQCNRRRSQKPGFISALLFFVFVENNHRRFVSGLSFSSKMSTLSRANSVALNVAIVPMFDDEFGDASDRSLNQYMMDIQQLKPLWIDEQYFIDMDRLDSETELSIQQKQEIMRSRFVTSASSQPGSYRVQIPLVQTSGVNAMFGMSLAEVSPGRVVCKRRLNLDTMCTEYVDGDAKDPWVLNLDGQFCGLAVSSVLPDSPIAQAGVQVGDVVTAISATMGGNVWPTSTLQGIQSALSSRKITSGTVTLELQRPSLLLKEDVITSTCTVDDTGTAASVAVSSDTQYELKLTRPLGFQIGETPDGYVVVTGIHPTAASNLVRHAVAVGDRIVAVDSSFGDTLWPVSTVEGVVSAVTSRLPGQTVTFRFERPKYVNGAPEAMSSKKNEVQPLYATKASSSVDVAFPETKSRTATADNVGSPLTQKELVQRCREVLRRYFGKQQDDSSVARSVYANSAAAVENRRASSAVNQLNALVADKVVDALAGASVMIDSITLSMIMNAYLQCQKPLSAVRIFEAATGFAGDGSTNTAIGASTIVGKTGGRVAPSESALNLYTGTALLQAHAALGDHRSVVRVLAALEGRSGILDKDDESTRSRKGIELLESAPWPWTGAYGTIQPDTVCYNIAIAAAEKIGGDDALKMALELFDQMCDPPRTGKDSRSKVVSSKDSRRPLRNEITYNTLMSVLCNEGQNDHAFRLLTQMQNVGLRPDKYTYTVLIKACDKKDDVQELLYAMRERGIQSDVVTYNTIIKLLCSKRLLTQATKIVTEMESRGIAPDSRTYGTLMSGLLDAGKANSCLALFESACANSRTGSLTENVHLYTTAITAASVLGNHERALDLVTRMTACGIKPTLQTLTAVMGACLAAGKPKFAAQLYQRIETPDGYAMYQGIQSLCEIGDVMQAADILATQRRGSRLLSGQQMMQSYQRLLVSAVERRDYAMAQRGFVDLLEKGYIPSKSILYTIFESMDLKKQAGLSITGENDSANFQFLLFMLDALRQRNLPVEGTLYIKTLSSGAQLGGLPRKVASLLARAKSKDNAVEMSHIYSLPSDPTFTEDSRVISGWVDLLDKYECLPKESMLLSQLPRLPVRVATRDLARVLRAEQSVTYSNRRNKQSGILKS
jgi:pentatricopeptide repeat protein